MDEDDVGIKTDRVMYGSLDAAALNTGGISSAIEAGRVNLANDAEHLELSKESSATRERQEALLAEFELKRRARSLAVPTDIKEVIVKLRSMGEPATLFGESPYDRRERLRKLLAKLDEADGGELPVPDQAEVLEQAALKAELFFTEGPNELAVARAQIAAFSLPRAAKRLAAAKAEREADPMGFGEEQAAEDAAAVAGRLVTDCSEIGDERPLSICAFRPDGQQLMTGSWSGMVKIWGLPECSRTLAFRAHEERLSGVAWHPQAGSQGEEAAAILTAACDREARLWTADGKLLRKLEGHGDRLGRCAWHPSGRYVGTASFDSTWRLWDVETGLELLCQEGHGRPVYGIAFQQDGALAASVGLDAHGWVWDLRTGRSVLTLAGHVKQTLAVDWSPDGHRIATGADDHTVRIWDLRVRKCEYVIPAHASLISSIRFEPRNGHTLLTSSYDCTVKVWGAHNYKLIRTLKGHDQRVMAADYAPGGRMVGTVSYDRTVKLWGPSQATMDPDSGLPWATAGGDEDGEGSSGDEEMEEGGEGGNGDAAMAE